MGLYLTKQMVGSYHNIPDCYDRCNRDSNLMWMGEAMKNTRDDEDKYPKLTEIFNEYKDELNKIPPLESVVVWCNHFLQLVEILAISNDKTFNETLEAIGKLHNER